MDLLGEADVALCNEKYSVISTVLIARDINHSALISWVDLQKLCVIPKSFPAVVAAAVTYNDIKTKTIAACPQVFSDTLDDRPMSAEKMKIYLKDNATPYRVSAPRPIPLRFQEPANSEIEKYIVVFLSGINSAPVVPAHHALFPFPMLAFSLLV